jgi:hypothetical protein
MAKHQKAIDAERNLRKKGIGEISSEFSQFSVSQNSYKEYSAELLK